MADITRCPTCQVPVLPDDSACWQCGTPLGGKEQVRVVATDSAEREDEQRERRIYLLLTAVVFLLALLAINRLSSAPLLQTALADALPSSWRYFTPADRSFTTPLPAAWQTTSIQDSENGAGLAQLVADYPLLEQALAPWSAVVDDMQLLLVARAADAHLQANPPDGATPFVLVARSARLGTATRPQLESLLPEDSGLIHNADIENYAKSYWLLRWELENWRCDQQLVTDRGTLYMQVVCTPAGTLGRNQQGNARITDGFQVLGR